jgi:CheY-like chemotaxis protein
MSQPKPGPPAPVNILVVDDRPAQLSAMEALLADLGENVVCVSSGADALRQLLERDFAVLLLDVNMPDMDGFETATIIRQRSRLRHIPIIFITAGSDDTHALQGYSLGAVDYILTPVVPEVLRTKVRVFVELFRMTAQLKRQADERVALAEERAARAAAEAASRRRAFSPTPARAWPGPSTSSRRSRRSCAWSSPISRTSPSCDCRSPAPRWSGRSIGTRTPRPTPRRRSCGTPWITRSGRW